MVAPRGASSETRERRGASCDAVHSVAPAVDRTQATAGPTRHEEPHAPAAPILSTSLNLTPRAPRRRPSAARFIARAPHGAGRMTPGATISRSLVARWGVGLHARDGCVSSMAQGATLGGGRRRREAGSRSVSFTVRYDACEAYEARGAGLPPAATWARQVDDGDEQDEREQEPRAPAQLVEVRVEDGGHFHRV